MSTQDASKLSVLGDMGYSGSTFFSTADERFIVKSVPRRFEHTFFRDDLLVPYTEHVRNNPYSLLIRITDFLESTHYSIGSLLGLAPSHRKSSVYLLALRSYLPVRYRDGEPPVW